MSNFTNYFSDEALLVKKHQDHGFDSASRGTLADPQNEDPISKTTSRSFARGDLTLPNIWPQPPSSYLNAPIPHGDRREITARRIKTSLKQDETRSIAERSPLGDAHNVFAVQPESPATRLQSRKRHFFGARKLATIDPPHRKKYFCENANIFGAVDPKYGRLQHDSRHLRSEVRNVISGWWNAVER